MFNNFLDSLDVTTNPPPVNTSSNVNMNYQQRTKSGSNHGAKVQAQLATNVRQSHNNTVQGHIGGKRNKQLVATSYNIAPAQLAQQQMGAQNSHSYAAMRLSQQAFNSGTGHNSLSYASGALNNSLGVPLQQAVNSSMDLNNSMQLNSIAGMGVRSSGVNSKNKAQFMNTSFDASKSANTINYVSSAYMSAIPTTQSNNVNVVPQGAKISKVGLKNSGSNNNSRQPTNIHLHAQANNYTDGTAMFLGHVAARQTGVNSLSQGPSAPGGSSHKNLYMSH